MGIHMESTVLRKPAPEDKDRIFQWALNPELRKMIGTRDCPTKEGHERWFAHKCDDESNEFLMIAYDGESVGIIGTNTIDAYNRSAEIYLYIGDTSHRGKGIGISAIKLFLRHLSEKYSIHKVYARIFSFNTPSVRLFEKAGFVLEGVQKEQIKAVDEPSGFCDLLWYGYIIENPERRS